MFDKDFLRDLRKGQNSSIDVKLNRAASQIGVGDIVNPKNIINKPENLNSYNYKPQMRIKQDNNTDHISKLNIMKSQIDDYLTKSPDFWHNLEDKNKRRGTIRTMLGIKK
jgi:hypothetical protein